MPSEAPSGRVNYPSNFQVENGWNLFLAGDYLYWMASADGLYFAQTGASEEGGIVAFDGTIKRIDPEWASGVRASVGITFPKQGYDLLLTWTYFSLNSHTSAHSEESTLLPLWATADFPTFAASYASGKWNLNLNLLDLEWGRSSWFGGHFSLRPFFGLRGASIHQTFDSNFDLASTLTSHIHSKSDVEGGGLRAGCDLRCALPHGFAIYGLASGSLLYAEINNGLRVLEKRFCFARTKDHNHTGISSLQLGLGLGWDTHFAKERLHIQWHLGWEQNIWYGANQMNHFMNQISSGYYFKESSTLSTGGLTAGGRFDF